MRQKNGLGPNWPLVQVQAWTNRLKMQKTRMRIEEIVWRCDGETEEWFGTKLATGGPSPSMDQPWELLAQRYRFPVEKDTNNLHWAQPLAIMVVHPIQAKGHS